MSSNSFFFAKRYGILILCIATFFIIHSCATITRSKKCNVKFVSRARGAKIRYQDSLYSLPAIVKVTRSKKDLPVTLVYDTVERDLLIRPSMDPAFFLGNLPFIPFGYIVDLRNPKRFSFGRKVRLNPGDTSSIIRTDPFYNYFSKSYPVNKGAVELALFYHFVNGYSFATVAGMQQSFEGFNGLGVGLNYYYARNKSIGISGSMTTAMPFPIGSVDYFGGGYERASVSYLSVTNDYKIRRLRLGYGLNYAFNRRERVYDDTLGMPRRILKGQSAGLVLKAHWQLLKVLNAGVTYRPTFITVVPEAELQYQHFISVDLMVTLSLLK